MRATFLDREVQAGYPDLPAVRRSLVASLRAQADPHDQELARLVAALSTSSRDFAATWARGEARRKGAGTKRFVHPAVGELELHHDALTVEGGGGQRLLVFHPEPGSPSATALALLGALAAAPA